MSILVNQDWHYEGSSASCHRQVYCSSLLIGRVCHWQLTCEDDSLFRERFTIEQWQDEAFIPIEGEHLSLEGALQRLLGYDEPNIERVTRRFTLKDTSPLIRIGFVTIGLTIVAVWWALEYWQ